MISRHAQAIWHGNGKDGKGSLSTESKALKDTPYGFTNRFEDTPGTNPEELIGAAHAGCFSMALAFKLNEAGFTATELKTSASVTIEKQDQGWTVVESHLKLEAIVPNIDSQRFQTIAEEAKAGCPISRVLNTKITLEVTLK